VTDLPEHWLLVRGTGERPLTEHVDPDALRRHSSTRRPAVQKGDLAICYASRWQVVFAVVEVSGDPANDPDRARWRWHFPIRPLVALADLRDAPPVQAAGVLPSSLGRHSYVRLTEEQFDAARRAIEASAKPS
jgi:EVE domain